MRSDAQRNTERLRAAALEVFQEKGLGSPLEEIAKRAGVSVGTLYNRFGSREALIDAVVPEVARAHLVHIDAGVAAVTGPRERVAAYVNGLVEMQIADPALSDAIASAYPDASQALKAVCEAALDEGARLIAEAQAAGVIRPGFTRDDLAALLFANAALIQSGGPEATRRIVGFLLAGLATD
jgi:AcrR family transcriptional regulator